MSHKKLKILTIAGSFITILFGIWHMVVPWLYRWFSYIPIIPAELKNAILATNFFLSTCLILLGVMSWIIIQWHWENQFSVKLILIIMNILWASRVTYQLIKPQGTMIPGLTIIMLSMFVFTFLLFLIPLIIVLRKKNK